MSRVVKLPGCMAAGCDPVNDALRRLIVPIRHTDRDITRMESDELSTGLRQLHGATLSGERLFDSRLHAGAAANMSGGVKGGRQGAPLDGGPPPQTTAWATQPLKLFPPARIKRSSRQVTLGL